MNKEFQEWSDDIIYKHALTFSHDELAGMYSLCNKREQDYLKEIKSLRLILQSHDDIVEMNSELKKENEKQKQYLKMTGIYDYGEYMDELKQENARLREALEDIIDSGNESYMYHKAKKTLEKGE